MSFVDMVPSASLAFCREFEWWDFREQERESSIFVPLVGRWVDIVFLFLFFLGRKWEGNVVGIFEGSWHGLAG
jgi:hypothetical protein